MQSRHAPQKPHAPRLPIDDAAECSILGVAPAGIREAFGTLYGEFGWNRLLGGRRTSANRILKEMVLARLAAPQSKRRTDRDLAEHGEAALNLDHVYKTMDHLDDRFVDALCDRSLTLAGKLYGGPVGVLFYDTTTPASRARPGTGCARRATARTASRTGCRSSSPCW